MRFWSFTFSLRMKYSSLLLGLLSLFVTLSSHAQEKAEERSDLERAALQFREFLLAVPGRAPSNLEARSHNSGVPELSSALNYAAQIGSDGSWAAINYADQARSRWRPYEHVLRMVAMAVQLQDKKLSVEQRKQLLEACSAAGSFWRKNDFKCPNWWYNEIGAPQSFGEYALLMGKELPPDDFAFITGTILERSGLRMTGQNKVWLSGNVLMKALLTHDQALAGQAAQAIWSEVAVVAEEGMQPDWSFHQHGPQQQFGNYGLGFAVEITRWVTILRGTHFALPQEKLADFRNYLLEGMNWTCWRGFMDISACARQLMPGSPAAKARSIKRVFENMRVADPSCEARYAAFVERNSAGVPNDLVGSRYFWRSEYGIHRQPNLFATLKMHSARVIGVETVNTENLAGRYLADGGLFLYSKGDEYAEIFPVLDWRHIPGTTLAWQPEVPRTGKPEDRQKTTWVGGVCDGNSSAAVMDYDRDGVSAHKAWFFRGSLVVCVGNSIQAPSTDEALHTTVNQCLLQGPVHAAAQYQHSVVVKKGIQQLLGITRIEHNGLSYGFFEPTSLALSQQTQSGNWKTVYTNPSTPKADQSHEVFGLWLDHGSRPHGASYAYWAGLSSEVEQVPELLSNSSELQSVRWPDGYLQFAFWKPGTATLTPGLTLTVSEPCLVQLEPKGEGWKLSLSDPSQSLKSVRLQLGKAAMDLLLPSGLMAGSTRHLSIP